MQRRSKKLLDAENKKEITKMTKESIIKLQDLALKITKTDESKFAKKKSQLANYCTYYHVQFWGRQFSPELTHSANGFLIRRKWNSDLPQLSKEFRIFYKDHENYFKTVDGTKDSSYALEIVPRTTPFQEPTWKRKLTAEDCHNQEESTIAICNTLKSLTREIITLFYRQTDVDGSEKNQFDLEKNKVQSKRKNF